MAEQTTHQAAERLRAMLSSDRITQSGRRLGLGDLDDALAAAKEEGRREAFDLLNPYTTHDPRMGCFDGREKKPRCKCGLAEAREEAAR